MRLGIGLLGVVCLAFAASLEAGRRYLSPFIAQKIHAGILEQVVWSPDSPPIVKGLLRSIEMCWIPGSCFSHLINALFLITTRIQIVS